VATYLDISGGLTSGAAVVDTSIEIEGSTLVEGSVNPCNFYFDYFTLSDISYTVYSGSQDYVFSDLIYIEGATDCTSQVNWVFDITTTPDMGITYSTTSEPL
jgi:hypothetical protein